MSFLVWLLQATFVVAAIIFIITLLAVWLKFTKDVWF